MAARRTFVLVEDTIIHLFTKGTNPIGRQSFVKAPESFVKLLEHEEIDGTKQVHKSHAAGKTIQSKFDIIENQEVRKSQQSFCLMKMLFLNLLQRDLIIFIVKKTAINTSNSGVEEAMKWLLFLMDDPGEHGMLDEAQKAFKEAEAFKKDTEDGTQECQQVATVGKFNVIWNFVGGIYGTNMGLFRISLMQTPLS